MDCRVGQRPVPVIRVGASALALFAQDDPFVGSDARTGVHHIAVGAADPQEMAGAANLQGATGSGLNDTQHLVLDPADTGGVRVRITEPLGLDVGASAAIERIDHLGVASSDNKSAKSVFMGQLGFAYESEQRDSEVEVVGESFTSDVYPIGFYNRPPHLVGSIGVTFLTVGDCELEFLQDLTATVTADEGRHNQAGNTRGDRSAIARYVSRRGAGLHHIALKTPDIDATLRGLRDAGHRMIDATGRPGSRRARIGFVHPSALGGLLMHFVERQEVS